MSVSVEPMVDVHEDAPRRCPVITGDGNPCGTPAAMLLASGYCFAHDPGNAERRAVTRQRGGLTTKLRSRRGLSPEELGPLDTTADAQRWLSRVALAAATGELSPTQAREVRENVTVWLELLAVQED